MRDDNPSDNVEKLFVKVFTADNSAKSLLADERMSVSVICRQLAEKNHIVMDPKCSIVEHLPELYLERFYEDNESLVENVLLWTRDSSNRLYFMEKEEKYDLFISPERYLLGSHSSERDHHLDDEAKNNLIDEFFTGGHPVPEVEGCLYLKSDGKKAWKRHFFVLRASGLYYSLKGKSKSSKDLVCLTTFEMNNLYYGFGWRKKYKAPTEYGFAIKHPQIQAKNSKYIKYLCADSEFELRLWTTGIRVAKYGRQMKDNYDNITRDIVEADLDSLADRRSFSVCSMAKSSGQGSPSSPVNSCASVSDSLPASEGYPSSEACSTSEGSSANSDTSPANDGQRPVRPTSITITSNYGNNHWHQMSRHDSIRSSSTSSSSGFLSERDSTVGTPTKDQLAFEADFPVGTIKRKPSAMNPKIPLTSTTRTLAMQSDDALVEVDSSDTDDDETGAQQHYGTLKSGTLRRSATDERINNRIYEPLREHRFQSIAQNNNIKTTVQSMCFDESVVDELPLPPPPAVLQMSLSTLSLNSLPPPPQEMLESPDMGSDSTPTPTPMSPVMSPASPRLPQVPPKPKLCRQMSGTAADRSFVNPMNTYSVRKIDPSLRTPTECYSVPSVVDLQSPNKTYGTLPRSPLNTYSVRATDSLPRNHKNNYSVLPLNQSSNGQMNTYSVLPINTSMSSMNNYSVPPIGSISQTQYNTYCLPPDHLTRSPMKGPLPPPPEEFLVEIQRVMEKKWKVAQALSTDHTATPNQILGFRDPVYLPPEHHYQNEQQNSNNIYDVLPSRPVAKQVRMSDQVSEIPPVGTPFLRPNQRRVPPPLPKRSESTRLSQRQVQIRTKVMVWM